MTVADGHQLQPMVAQAWYRLKANAASSGINLKLLRGFAPYRNSSPYSLAAYSTRGSSALAEHTKPKRLSTVRQTMRCAPCLLRPHLQATPSITPATPSICMMRARAFPSPNSSKRAPTDGWPPTISPRPRSVGLSPAIPGACRTLVHARRPGKSCGSGHRGCRRRGN
jgi:hypothetical protein